MPVLALLTFTFAALLAGLTVGALLNRTAFERKVDAEVADLFSEVETMPTYYSEQELEGLPEPIRRFMDRNLHEGQPHPSCVRVRERGSYRQKVGQPWIEFLGELYTVAGRPTFLWVGRLRPMPVVWLDLRALYLRGRGTISLKILSSVSSIEAEDNATRKALLIGYLSDLVLLPPALLAGDNLSWEAIDEHRARATLRDGELEVSGVFEVDDFGDVVAFETDERPWSGDGRPEQVLWRVRYAEHRAFGELNLPTKIAAEWQLDDTSFPYFRREIEAVEVDVPRRWGAIDR